MGSGIRLDSIALTIFILAISFFVSDILPVHSGVILISLYYGFTTIYVTSK